jgi:glycosyltransferase involved in cell wall biosynthesis
MTAREAMAYGRPVITTGVGGLADLAAAAVIVPARDPAALRSAVEGLLADADRRHTLGTAGRTLAERSWSPPAAAERLVAAYDQARVRDRRIHR